MSKTLTEQWKNGELKSGMYYWKLPNNETFMATLYKMDEYKQTKDASKIVCLAPVPSYDEYKRLQEQLKEANEVIDACCSLPETNWVVIDSYKEKWSVK